MVATPAGARVRTRLRVPDADAAVLRAAGEHLGSLTSADLAARCAEGRPGAKGRAGSRRVRKQRSPRNRPPGLHLANRPDGRYLDASWKTPAIEPVTLDQARMGNVVSVDVNAGHLAMAVLDPDGNQIGVPRTIGLPLAGLPATPRDGHLRAAISHILHTAREHHAAAVVIENLDLGDARRQGGERTGNRPSKGRRGRAFRHQLTGIPTARFRDRLTHVACNAGLAVIAVDPAYTSRGPDGPRPATRRPKTVPGRPPRRTRSCWVSRNGGYCSAHVYPAAGVHVPRRRSRRRGRAGRVRWHAREQRVCRRQRS